MGTLLARVQAPLSVCWVCDAREPSPFAQVRQGAQCWWAGKCAKDAQRESEQHHTLRDLRSPASPFAGFTCTAPCLRVTGRSCGTLPLFCLSSSAPQTSSVSLCARVCRLCRCSPYNVCTVREQALNRVHWFVGRASACLSSQRKQCLATAGSHCATTCT